jgi:hypothetical protein
MTVLSEKQTFTLPKNSVSFCAAARRLGARSD